MRYRRVRHGRLRLNNSREQAKKLDVLCARPVSEQKLRDQLTHAQYALAQEVATREALQTHAADDAAQIAQLQTDLAFFRKQQKPN